MNTADDNDTTRDDPEHGYPQHYQLPGNWAWTARAACRDRPDINWDDPEGIELRRARQVCTACEVRIECLHSGIARAEPSGIWGGTTVEERKALHRARARAAPPKPPPPHGTDRRYLAPYNCSCEPCRNAHAAEERRRRRDRLSRAHTAEDTDGNDDGDNGRGTTDWRVS